MTGGFPSGSAGKESTCNVGDPGSIPGSRRSAGEGTGYPLQYSCLENPHGQRQEATVRGISESDTTEQLSTQMTNFVEHLFLGLSVTCKSSLVMCLFRHCAHLRESPVVQRLRLWASSAVGTGSSPAAELRAPGLVVPWPKIKHTFCSFEKLSCLGSYWMWESFIQVLYQVCILKISMAGLFFFFKWFYLFIGCAGSLLLLDFF